MPHLFPVPLKRPAAGLVAGAVLAGALAAVLVLAGGDTALAAAAPANPPSGGGDPFRTLYTNVSGAVIGALTAGVACVLGWKLVHNLVRPSMGQLAAVLLLGAIASYFVLDHANGVAMLKDTIAHWTH